MRTTRLDAAVIAVLTKARTPQQVILVLDLLERVYGRPPVKAGGR